jgi:hypothetical protein
MAEQKVSAGRWEIIDPSEQGSPGGKKLGRFEVMKG